MASSTRTCSLASYLRSLSQTPLRLRRRMFATWTPEEELNQVRLRSGADMKRKLYWYDLVALGVGGMLGVGVFVTTGPVARDIAGPSVFISYVIAGVTALLSSLCYTEFSVQVPVAGGAFSYLRVTFGEFVGYFAGANILMEYVLSNAAAARTFTDYLCHAVGETRDNCWRIEVEGLKKGYNMLDFPAVALVLLLTLCLCRSTKGSSILNLVMTIFHVIFFGFIIICGFWNGSANNLISPEGMIPFGARGVVNGAAKVYFSYIGYDSVSTMAEEIQDPWKSLPIGIVGSMAIVSTLYCLMSLSLCIMVPYNEISHDASFSAAFERIGWKWASNLVGAGASLGVVASLVVAMLGQARYLCVIGRARLVPAWLAKVLIFRPGLCTASIALFTDLDIVIEMISIGTLVVFYLVGNALVYRRYGIDNDNDNGSGNGNKNPFRTLLFLFLLSASALGFALLWKQQRWWGLAALGGFAAVLTAYFHYANHSKDTNLIESSSNRRWSVPFMPWPAAASIFLGVFLMTTLKAIAFQRFGVWSCAITVFYVLYGVHSTYKGEEMDKETMAGHESNSNVVRNTIVSLMLVQPSKMEAGTCRSDRPIGFE